MSEEGREVGLRSHSVYKEHYKTYPSKLHLIIRSSAFSSYFLSHCFLVEGDFGVHTVTRPRTLQKKNPQILEYASHF